MHFSRKISLRRKLNLKFCSIVNKIVSIHQHRSSLTVEIPGDDPDDERTKAQGSYYFISPLLVCGFNIYDHKRSCN